MAGFFVPGSDPEGLLRSAVGSGYAMEEELFIPEIGTYISKELAGNDYLVDYTELIPTKVFYEKGMKLAGHLHMVLNSMLCRIHDAESDYLQYFSVRVFQSGEHGTTIHRNHNAVGPWVVGLTLEGNAPFNVYSQEVLEDYYTTIPLRGDGNDPEPLDSIEAGAGSAWVLYTADQQMPHSSGLVRSEEDRELLIFYSTDWSR